MKRSTLYRIGIAFLKISFAIQIILLLLNLANLYAPLFTRKFSWAQAFKDNMSKGVPTKDNRWNDGCVWVRADPQIEMIMKKVYIKGRQFKYASKCRAFSGEPGWYY